MYLEKYNCALQMSKTVYLHRRIISKSKLGEEQS